jgi:hypothetical protein
MSFDTLPVPTNARDELAVIAGHFEWGVWKSSRSQAECSSANVRQGGLSSKHPVGLQSIIPRIFVMLREPIERTISLYYERLFPEIKISLNSLSLEDLDFYLINFRGSAFSAWRDEGFSDSTCRMLCGANVHKGKAPHEVSEAEAASAKALINDRVAISRLHSTVVGLTHRWEETKTIISFWYPWLDITNDDVRGNTGGKKSYVESIGNLKLSHRALIEDANSCDLALYSEGLRQFDRQLGAVFTKWK